MTSYSILKTPMSDILLSADETHLTGLYFAECAHVPAARPSWKLDPRHPILEQAREQLEEYLKGARTTFSLPLYFHGTDFQQRIWQRIALIPFGETVTYSDLAAGAGNPDAIRAAGTATGRNPIGIIIPCHRIVGKHGSLGGFAGGLPWKRHLLSLEQSTRSIALQMT